MSDPSVDPEKDITGLKEEDDVQFKHSKVKVMCIKVLLVRICVCVSLQAFRFRLLLVIYISIVLPKLLPSCS